MSKRSAIIIGCWFVNNAAALGLLAFSDSLLLRIIGWLWLSASITVAGLVEIGGISETLEAKSDYISGDDK